MKTYSPIVRRRARHVRVPAFCPIPLRARADGWTPGRQAAFLAALALTRSVSAAARRVGMARETAYRLRRREDGASFAAAWDAVLEKGDGARRKVTPEERARRAIHGLLKPMIYRGAHAGNMQKADNSALLSYLTQIDRAERAGRPVRGKSQSFAPRSASTSQGDNSTGEFVQKQEPRTLDPGLRRGSCFRIGKSGSARTGP